MERRGLNIRKGFLKAVLPIFRALPLAGGFAVRFGNRPAGVPAEPERSGSHSTRRSRRAERFSTASGMCARSVASSRATMSCGEPETCCSTAFPTDARSRCSRSRAKSTWTRRWAQGKGCIVLANHFGAHLLPAHWLFRENYPVRFYMERPRHISRYMSRHFQTDGPLGQDKLFISRQGVPADSASSILRAARAIKAGMLLYLAGDVRWTGKLTETAEFLGRSMRFSTTWVVLAAMTEAPVVMVFCRMEPDGRYHIEFRPAFHVPKDAPEHGETAVLGPALPRDPGRPGSAASRPTATTISSGATRTRKLHEIIAHWTCFKEERDMAAEEREDGARMLRCAGSGHGWCWR